LPNQNKFFIVDVYEAQNQLKIILIVHSWRSWIKDKVNSVMHKFNRIKKGGDSGVVTYKIKIEVAGK